MYELTPLLTTVAGCSATMIAIIGGFMVRKLIAVSTERHEISSRLADFDEKIQYQQNRLEQFENHAKTIRNLSEGVYRERENLLSAIELLEIERRHAAARLDVLNNPHGMKKGLLVFVVFTLLGVFVPLALVPFTTDRFTLFVGVKVTVLLLFGGCLAYVYYYLLYLLNWKQKEVVRRWREYLPFFRTKKKK